MQEVVKQLIFETEHKCDCCWLINGIMRLSTLRGCMDLVGDYVNNASELIWFLLMRAFNTYFYTSMANNIRREKY